MLPEPTLPKRRAAAPAPQPWVMTPLFCVPDAGEDEGDPVPAPGRRSARPPGRRGNPRGPASPRGAASPRGPANPRGAASPRGAPSPRGSGSARAAGNSAKRDGLPDPPDLLAVTAQRLRRALARSFLRYGIPGDPEAAVHAAMNVIEPVLQARDTEIMRLRRLMTAAKAAR
jgi:hypothetical protein